jgi:hypothetical protein
MKSAASLLLTIALGVTIVYSLNSGTHDQPFRGQADDANQRLNAASQQETRSEKELREKLVGSWKIVSASFDGKPSELHRTSVTIKHITPVHIIWIGYQPEDRKIFRSAGGSWTIAEGRYVETMRYGLADTFKKDSFGATLGFDCRFEGDKWIQSGKLPNGVMLEEIWQRVRENEDVAEWPSEQQK